MENSVSFNKANNIQVAWDLNRSELVICVPFKETTNIYKLPEDTPNKEIFISLVFHQSDLKMAYEYLRLISNDQNITISEALFVAALNNCMKCFKHSKRRQKLIKEEVFRNDPKLLSCFTRFECIRDKHYVHDENGMLQPIATMLVSEKENSNIFVFRPWVIWNREPLDFIQEGVQLKKIVEYVTNYIQDQLNSLAKEIVPYFVGKYKFGDKPELVDSVVAASYNVVRNSGEEQLKKIPIRIMNINLDRYKIVKENDENNKKCD